MAVGWAGYFNGLMADIGVTIPPEFSTSPIHMAANHALSFSGAYINLPAAFLIIALTTLLVIGIRATATFNGIMVLLKLIVVLLVIGFGLQYVTAANLTPFIPPNTGSFGAYGWSGILRASAWCSSPISALTASRSRRRKPAIRNATCRSASWDRLSSAPSCTC